MYSKILISAALLVATAMPSASADDAPVEASQRRAYVVDADQSVVLIEVFRGGLLKRAGHDHVVASENVSGRILVADDPSASRAALRIQLRDLVVDKPEYRTRFGLEAEVSQDSIDGTTRNMQTKVLPTAQHPDVGIRAALIDSNNLDVEIDIGGATYAFEIPAEVVIDDERVHVTGAWQVNHSELGLRPFKAALGLLRVAERLVVTFDIVAEATASDAEVD